MYLTTFAQDARSLDLTGTEEFAALQRRAAALGLAAGSLIRCVSRNIILNGLRFHFLEWGKSSSPPLLVLHGGAQTGHSWDLISLTLGDRFHIIAIDQRGHGDSEWPRDGCTSVEGMADDARLVIETLGLEQPLVCGHSMGGQVTMALLIAHPDIARKAVLVDIGPELAPDLRERVRQSAHAVHEYATLDEYAAERETVEPLRSRDEIRKTAPYYVMRRKDGTLVPKHDPQYFYALGEGDADVQSPPLEAAHRITCPVLLLRGEKSTVLLPDAAERFVAALPHGELVVVPNAGHTVHLENPLGFLSAVTPFLELRQVLQ
jgi:pimeloyl-ACP methyl ester carboxylesterase